MPGGQTGRSILPGHTNTCSDPTHDEGGNVIAHRHKTGAYFSSYPKRVPIASRMVIRLLPWDSLRTLRLVMLFTTPTPPIFPTVINIVNTPQILAEDEEE